jgi:hypothetical protein
LGTPFVLQQAQNDRDLGRATGAVSGRLPALPSSGEQSLSKTFVRKLARYFAGAREFDAAMSIVVSGTVFSGFCT